MTTGQLHQRFLRCSGVSTDTRKIPANTLFFALKGVNFNGNTFAAEALEKGARYAVVDEAEYATSENIILVDDVLKSLQQLARYHRNLCKAKIIALTGSNGKTTTKELINSVLSQAFNTVATKGNLNNHIGVPLTLLTIQDDTEFAIVEMGANHQGEIAALCDIAEPDYGYITNFGKAHLEGFGGVQGVIKGKSELYNFLIRSKRHIFFNADDPIQKDRLGDYPMAIGYSRDNDAYLRIGFLDANPFVRLKFNSTFITTQLVGSFNFYNCAAATLIGNYFDVPHAQIKRALESYLPVSNRSQLLEKNGYRILLDAYNANPSSMQAALDNFELMPGSVKTVFLGDMFELGESAGEEHQQIARLAASKGFAEVYLIGENFSRVETAFQTFSSFEEFKSYLTKNKPAPGNLLIKGSRGMALERIIDIL